MVSNKAKKNQTNKTQHMTIFHLVIRTGFKASHACHGSEQEATPRLGVGVQLSRRQRVAPPRQVPAGAAVKYTPAPVPWYMVPRAQPGKPGT